MTVRTPGAWLTALMAIGFGAVTATGCTGDTGPAGDPGDPGVNCWDLNGNGECDPDSEDFTDDGVCDIQDCRGTDGGGGDPGVACWDLDENGECDADTEDVNEDGSCTVADCAGVIFGVLSGTVTNDAGDALEGVTISLFPAVAGVDLTSDASGNFEADLPVGSYAVTFELDGYESMTVTAPIATDETTTVDVALVPTAGVTVDAGDDVHDVPGASADVTADVTIRDGSSADSYSWTHVSGPELTISGETTDTLSVTFADAATYRAELLDHLTFPTNRLQVLGINHFALEESLVSTYMVTVTTSTGTYTDTVSFHADTDYDVSPGIANVPTGRGVLLYTPDDTSYTWSLSGPGSATLDATDTQTVLFVPDAVGEWTVTANGTDILVRAGEWVGAVGGIGSDGNVDGSTGCTGCHNGGVAPDMFTPWRESGHAEIFQNNLNTSGHYGESCFQCHTVGYDPDADNGGFDDQSDYTDFVDDILHAGPSPDNYSTMESDTPDAFALTNIQCENCHGPSFSDHTTGLNPERISYSSDVCASCHGEPKRHARFQQWELSGHANFDLATGRGSSDSCAACHSAQGYIAAIDEGLSTGTMPTSVTAPSAEEAQPQTCVACHDPHMQGDMSGEPNNATVRVQGSTPVLAAGFAAVGVGRGAVCMTCHNSRRGLANDTIGSVPAGGRAPHGPTQTDIIMGQNVFFVSVGARAGHSYLADTCATCHMEATDPPDELSYSLGGTNHTFSASVEICNDCHGDFDGEGLTEAFELEIENLAEHLGEWAGTYLNTFDSIDVVAVDPTDGAESAETTVDLTSVSISEAHVTEGHGRMELDLVFDSAVDFDFSGSTRSLTEIAVQLAELQVGGTSTAVFPDSGNYAKAQWNYHMLHNDSSHGVHNPSFVNDVLVNTMTVDLSVGAATP